MQLCIKWNQRMVPQSGSFRTSQSITKTRISSVSVASHVPLGHRYLGKKSTVRIKISVGPAKCSTSGIESTSEASPPKQIIETEASSTSTSSQPVAVNCFTEGGLELEDTEKDVLKIASRKDAASSDKHAADELKAPNWVGSGPPVIHDRETDNVDGTKLSSYKFGVERRRTTSAEASFSGGSCQSLEPLGEEAVSRAVSLWETSHGESLQDDGRVVKQPFISGPTSTTVEDEQSKNIWQQIKDILLFAGPALGIWWSPPIISLIDTAVVGNSSSLQLAALGPGTILCDQLSYVFTFLSIATSNLIATSLANKDKAMAEKHLSQLLFVAMTCGLGMLLLIEIFGTSILRGFVGANNSALIPIARTYVEIRGFAWPAVLVGMVAQSASLGMRDSWSPLKNLAITSLLKCVGNTILCTFFGYGIVGAAWATLVSQVLAAFLMLRSLHKKGYNTLAITIPSIVELVQMIRLAGPVLLTMLSKVAFYTFITYLATSLGTITLAAHQVMIGVFCTCTTSGEPLAQTALSFMPALMYGLNRNIKKARILLRSLLVIGTIFGLSLGCIAVTVPWLFPQVFTRDIAIIRQMRGVTLPFFLGLIITPSTLSLEGTLLAARDLKYISLSMISCLCGGCIVLMTLNKSGFGLEGSWWALLAFQWARFILAFIRVASPKSVLKVESFVDLIPSPV